MHWNIEGSSTTIFPFWIIIVFNNSGATYTAFDAACPNQALSSCSTMALKKLDPLDPLKIDKTTISPPSH